MSITVIVDLHAKPECTQLIIDRFKVALPETRSAKGCIELKANRDLDDPNHLMVIERWASREDYQAYFKSRQQSGSLDTMASRLAQPLKVIYLEPQEG